MISLLEFLQSANKDKFVSILMKQDFSHMIDSIMDNSKLDIEGLTDWGNEIICVKTDYVFELLNESNFVKFCRKYQWVPTFTKYFYDTGEFGIIVEPISKNKVHFDTVYHITPIKYYNKFISKKGLSPIGTLSGKWIKSDTDVLNDDSIFKHTGKIKRGYRSITPKIFAFSDLTDFDEISYQIGAGSDYVVLKIDLSDHKNFVFYKDTANPDNVSAYYTFEHIPKELISIDYELTKKLQRSNN